MVLCRGNPWSLCSSVVLYDISSPPSLSLFSIGLYFLLVKRFLRAGGGVDFLLLDLSRSIVEINVTIKCDKKKIRKRGADNDKNNESKKKDQLYKSSAIIYSSDIVLRFGQLTRHVINSRLVAITVHSLFLSLYSGPQESDTILGRCLSELRHVSSHCPRIVPCVPRNQSDWTLSPNASWYQRIAWRLRLRDSYALLHLPII